MTDRVLSGLSAAWGHALLVTGAGWSGRWASPWRLPPRSSAAVLAGRVTAALSRAARRGSGTTLPGRVALRLDPALIGRLTRARPVVIVSGTNGKTTTTRFVAAGLRAGHRVVTNDSGANLMSGVASALLASTSPRTCPAVLEVDELALPALMRALDASAVVVVLLNLSRDQLDRGGEVSAHVTRWSTALTAAPTATVVANADDPLVCTAVLRARPDGSGVRWVATGGRRGVDVPLCPRCQAPWSTPWPQWSCAACGLARPTPTWSTCADAVTTPRGDRIAVELALPGRVNLSNAAMAAAACDVLSVPARVTLSAASTVLEVAGRYLRTTHRGVGVRLLLGKNPAGWTEVLDLIEPGASPVVLAVNAGIADGADVSWLWDVPFERLRGRRVIATGERSEDLSVRLHYAGVVHEREADPLWAVASVGASECEVVANYTAFTRVRAQLVAVGAPRGPGAAVGP